MPTIAGRRLDARGVATEGPWPEARGGPPRADDAEVVAPKELREEMRTILAAALGRYAAPL